MLSFALLASAKFRLTTTDLMTMPNLRLRSF